jgi:putative transposase
MDTPEGGERVFREGTRPQVSALVGFIDSHKGRFGIEPSCAVLEFPASTYYAAKKGERQPSRRRRRDEWLKKKIMNVWADRKKGRRLYGARKVWRQLCREGIKVARCTVERLMRELGIEGAAGRRKKPRTTIPAPAGQQPADLVGRDFTAPAPNRRWVADITYTDTASGFAYTAFITDLFARKIVGWQVADHLRADLALDALEMAIFARRGQLGEDLVHHSDRGVQYTSIRYTKRLEDIGAVRSVGSKGDSYDNAAAEAVNSLYKKELIDREGPWEDAGHVTVETAEWVHWYNNERLHSTCGNVPPAEYENDWLIRQAHTIIIPETKAS